MKFIGGMLGVIACVAFAACGGGSSSTRESSLSHFQLQAHGASRPDLQRSAAILTRRLHAAGYSDASVRVSGNDTLAVSAPAETNGRMFKRGEFGIYDWENRVVGANPFAGTSRSRAAQIAAKLPKRTVIVGRKDMGPGPASLSRYFVLTAKPSLDGGDVTDPRVETLPALPGESSQPSVSFQFTPSGRSAWRSLIRSIGDRPRGHFGVVLDDDLLSLPFVGGDAKQMADSPSGEIGGDFSSQGAREIVAILANGPLPVLFERR